MCMNVLPAFIYMNRVSAWCLQRSEGVRSPTAGVTGNSEPPGMGAGNLAYVLWKSSTLSELLN